MRVVHLIESFAGGSAQVVLALTRVKTLPDGRPLEHVVVHGWRSDSSEEFAASFGPGVKLVPWPGAVREISPVHDAKALWRLLAIFRALGDFDVLHLHSSKAGVLGRVAALLTGRRSRTLYTAHGVAMLRHDVSERKRRLYALIERRAAVGSRVVVACSPSEQAVFAAEGVPARLIPNGMPDAAAVAARTGELKRVLAVGRLSAQKDPAVFAELARSAAGLGLEFVWVGEGELREAVAGSPVAVTGWLTQEQVLEQLQQADLFISTSRWEGLSLAALQAMGAGLPLLLRRCPGNTDLLLTDDFSAGFDSVAEALAWLSATRDNPPRLQAMGQAARAEFVKSYTEAAMCQAYTRLYAELIDARGVSRGK